MVQITTRTYLCGLFALMLSVASTGWAQEIAVNGVILGDPKMQNTIRTKYENSSEIPDGIAFESLLNQLQELQRLDPDLAKETVMSNLSLNATEASTFLAAAAGALKQHTNDVMTLRREMLCDHSMPIKTGDGAFQQMNSLDDAQETIGKQNLLEFETGLDSNLVDRFRNWVADWKSNVVYVKFDHKELARLNGQENVDFELSAYCSASELASRSNAK